MIKDGGLSFKTQLKIEFLPQNNSSKICLEKSLVRLIEQYNETLDLGFPG